MASIFENGFAYFFFFSKRWDVRVKNNTEQNKIIVNNPWDPMQTPKIYYWTYERPKGNQKTFTFDLYGGQALREII